MVLLHLNGASHDDEVGVYTEVSGSLSGLPAPVPLWPYSWNSVSIQSICWRSSRPTTST